MISKTRVAILLLISMTISAAAADDVTPTAVEKEKQTLESYAEANKACREWTDGCAVCARHDDGTFGCSLPGIACEPSGLTCRNVAAGTKDTGIKPSGTPDAPAK